MARRRARRTAWSNGGKEVELARESCAADRDDVEAVAILETRALGLKGRDTRILATCAMPLRLSWLEEAGLGRDRLIGVTLREGRLQTRIETVYARKTIALREEPPVGHLAREAVADLFLRGSLFKKTLPITQSRLEEAALARDLETRGLAPWPAGAALAIQDKPQSPREWVIARLEEVGLESGDDLGLLTAADFLPPELPGFVTRELNALLPRRLFLPSGRYRVEYDLSQKLATVVPEKGTGPEPPSLSYLPRWRDFGVRFRRGDQIRTLRTKG